MQKIKMNYRQNKTFEEVFNEFLEDKKASNFRNGTIKHYEDSYRQIVKYMKKDAEAKSIDEKVFKKFLLKCKKNNELSDNGVYIYARDLKTIINYSIAKGYTPFFRIELPKKDKHIVETYTDDELIKLLKKPDIKTCKFVEYRNWAITSFFLSTGIRLSSLLNIKISDLKLSEDEVEIIHMKARNSITVPLNNQIKNILKEYLQYRQYETADEYLFCNVYGKQLSKSTITQALLNYNKNRGVSSTGIHRLRHTFAKKWIIGGNSVVSLQHILGHSSLQMTQNYINILVSDLKKDVDNYNILQEFQGNKSIKMKK
ncbi:MAG: tyrosine-type recombinase/integrase [Clostridium butyricum]|nr:tyrosine-type recombinase/integrase [Clostridium butyricum]MDU3581114.1 tyrosine-type recombinase/integrase [Clostridium butyricum]MDU3594676.1 tyrosine-type recombinase/integrase [Clostridium butyricum]